MSHIENIIQKEREKLNGVTDQSYGARVFINFLISEGITISDDQKKIICYITGVARFIDNLIDDTPLSKQVILEGVIGKERFPEIEKVTSMLANSEQIEFFIQQTINTINATLYHADKVNNPLLARIKECEHLTNGYLTPLYFDSGNDPNYKKAYEITYQIWIVGYLVSDIVSFFKDKRLTVSDLIDFFIFAVKVLVRFYFFVKSKSEFLKMFWKVGSHGFLRRFYKILGQDKLDSYENKVRASYKY